MEALADSIFAFSTHPASTSEWDWVLHTPPPPPIHTHTHTALLEQKGWVVSTLFHHLAEMGEWSCKTQPFPGWGRWAESHQQSQLQHSPTPWLGPASTNITASPCSLPKGSMCACAHTDKTFSWGITEAQAWQLRISCCLTEDSQHHLGNSSRSPDLETSRANDCGYIQVL